MTCNYPARKLGIKKLQLISEAKDKCPNLILRSGEDLTPFRKASNEIYHATKSFFLEYRSKISTEFRSEVRDNDAEDVLEVAIMKSGLDEIFIDVTMLASFVSDNVVANEIAYMASINDNTCHLLGDAFSQSAEGIEPGVVSLARGYSRNRTSELGEDQQGNGSREISKRGRKKLNLS